MRHAAQVNENEVEVVDGLPVLAADAAADVEPRREAGPAEVIVSRGQVAALAVSGFAAGAATMALAHRRSTRKALGRGRQKRLPFGEVLSSNSFLVDVHLLRRD
ncbi:MAG: hypothetical protein QOF29_3898 [bacterium]